MESLFATPKDRAFAETLSRLISANPFLEERILLEREALGGAYIPGDRVWNARAGRQRPNPNVSLLAERAWGCVRSASARRGQLRSASPEEQRFFEDLVFYVLYQRCEDGLLEVALSGKGRQRLGFYDEFAQDLERLLGPEESRPFWRAPHLFAICYQIRRAFDQIYRNLVGDSMPMARLRAAVWQSIFTRDLRRYVRALCHRMRDLTTLITGPSGTGKELVAQAIGLSRYIPFDPVSRTFKAPPGEPFVAVNLSALSPTLIESELFGHRRGAFTSALQDRVGWLEMCRPQSSVFLDEIGELDASIQVKLLRVLQDRSFQRLGETEPRVFEGKVIAATNKDLAAEISAGRFREDFYYRLCSDMIQTPSLAERLKDSPTELGDLILFLAGRIVGQEEAQVLASEVKAFLHAELEPGYLWPGNVRELEQCIRNILIRGRYTPQKKHGGSLAQAIEAGSLSAEELLSQYCNLVYEKAGSYQEAARRLRLDRRTLKQKLNLSTENG